MILEELFTVWTHCYHVTSAANSASIRQSRVLQTAHDLFIQAKREDLLNQRRTEDVLLLIEGERRVSIRNQCPLDPDSLDLGPICTLSEYIECLNSHVYFWPGTASGPIDDGVRMCEKSSCGRSIILKVPTQSLFNANRKTSVRVSTCNTGVAWRDGEVKSRRNPDVFEPIADFSEDPRRICEISFSSNMHLSEDVEYTANLAGPWRRF
jgi:hypothetical protein